MFILQKLSQHRNDFTATMQCEHCDHQQALSNGYNDDHYYNVVIPAMPCGKCGKKGVPVKVKPAIPKPYFATFPGTSPLSNNYVGIIADSTEAARQAMFDVFGQAWGFIYPAEGLEHQVKKYKIEPMLYLQVIDYKTIKINQETFDNVS